MPRLMSVTLTEQAVVDRTKTVSRRLGWKFLQPGDRLTLCRKVMGRRRGEPLVRLADVEVIDVRREKLGKIDTTEIQREGVHTDLDPLAWVAWFCSEMKCTPDTVVTRIEWRYLHEDES